MRNRNIIPGRMFISNHGMGRVAPITAPDSSPGDGQCRLGQNTGIRIVKRKRNHRIKTSAPASQHRPESEERCSLWSIERQRCRSCFSPFFFFFSFFQGWEEVFFFSTERPFKKTATYFALSVDFSHPQSCEKIGSYFQTRSTL